MWPRMHLHMLVSRILAPVLTFESSDHFYSIVPPFLHTCMMCLGRIGLDDLSAALADQGVTSKRPVYHL